MTKNKMWTRFDLSKKVGICSMYWYYIIFPCKTVCHRNSIDSFKGILRKGENNDYLQSWHSSKKTLLYSCFLLMESLTEQYYLHSESGYSVPSYIIKVHTINMIKGMMGIILQCIIKKGTNTFSSII